MADYKELIRKAIQALPENNGAARRAVYEKARAALVGQLRGLNPPLAARDITQHRLQLEDCIRQVEQEASEAVIAGLKQNEEIAARPAQPALPPPRAGQGQSRPAPPRAAPATRTPPAAPPRQPAAATTRPAANSAAPRPLATPAARPSMPPPAPRSAPQPAAPRLATMQSKTAASASAVSAATKAAGAPRPVARLHTASYPQAVVVEPEPEPELEPETIEDIIAAAEGAGAVPDEAEYDDVADDAAPLEEELVDPEPEMAEEFPAEEEEAVIEPRRRDRQHGPIVEPPVIHLDQRTSRRAAPAPEPEPEQEPEPEAMPTPRPDSRPVPSIVARAEAAKAAHSSAPRPTARGHGGTSHGATGPGVRGPAVTHGAAAHGGAASRQQRIEPTPINGRPAMSSIREVDVEAANDGDPQIAIERAIATLEREARNEHETGVADFVAEAPVGRVSPKRRRGVAESAPEMDDEAASGLLADQPPAEVERGGGSAITIFLLIFLVLLIIAAGAGFWAWREGYIDFDAMFGKAQPVATQTTRPAANATAPGNANTGNTAPSGSAAQTNTEVAPSLPAQSSEQLSAAPAAGTTTAPSATPAPAEPSAQVSGTPKSEARLSQSTDTGVPAPATGDAGKAAADTTAASGSQSLLLEASQDGTTGAVPFSGTVEWSKGTDEMGQPTLVGKADIPARNLGVSVLIRRNSDPTLPASHLMEINFSVTDSFIGGAISGLPGVLMKNEELVQGTPLIGASARVVGNSFLFALSSSKADEATNKDLLTSRKWMDLAIIYATGKKAIITLEKDDKAEALFNQVFAAWDKEPPVAPAAGK